mmetsp:Transcript_110348/g.351756  ORF Transcript_110348/g.351756 Transcript_110348/m.351756 type:complete len:664 (-) Transcript_110348:83-2074(-)
MAVDGGRSPNPLSFSPMSRRTDNDIQAKVARGVGTVGFLARWINYLSSEYSVFKPITAETFFQDLRDGLVLCRVVQQLVPGADFSKGVCERPLAEKSCLGNLEKALTYVWRQGIKAAHMCPAEDFIKASQQQQKQQLDAARARKAVTRCMVELFTVLQMRQRDARARSREVVQRMQDLLLPMGRPLSPQTLAGEVGALQADFAGGTRVMALLIASGRVKANKVFQLSEEKHSDQNEEHWLQNGEVLNRTLIEVGCPVLLSPAEWISPPSPFPDTLHFQLFVIWEFCNNGDNVELVKNRKMYAPKDEAMVHFAQFIRQHLHNFDEAFSRISQNNMDRLSRTNFMLAMRQLDYDGDAKFIWHMLDSGTQTGFVARKSWQALGQEVQRLLNERGLDAAPLAARAPPPLAAGGQAAAAAIAGPGGPQPDPEAAAQAYKNLLSGSVAKHPSPTTSINVQVVLNDQTLRHICLQTNVTDRGPDSLLEESEQCSPVLVLELRERSSLCAVIDVSQILGVEQLVGASEAPGSGGGNTTVSFVVAMLPGADLHDMDPAATNAGPLGLSGSHLGDTAFWNASGGDPPLPRTSSSMFHAGRGGSVLLCFSAGPSPWVSREAIKFFDELRILVYFTQHLEHTQEAEALGNTDQQSVSGWSGGLGLQGSVDPDAVF